MSIGPCILTTSFWIVIQPSPKTSHKCVLLCSDTNFLNSGKFCNHNFFLFNRLKPYLTDSCKLKLAFVLVSADHLTCKHQCSVKGQDCRVAVPGLCWWLPVWERVRFRSAQHSICIISLELPYPKPCYHCFNWCWLVYVYEALKAEKSRIVFS